MFTGSEADLLPELVQAVVIQMPDGLETASARSKLSFRQEMFVYSVSFEALPVAVNRHTTVFSAVHMIRTLGS